MRLCTTAWRLMKRSWPCLTLATGCLPVGGASRYTPPWPTPPRHHCSWRSSLTSPRHTAQTNSPPLLVEISMSSQVLTIVLILPNLYFIELLYTYTHLPLKIKKKLTASCYEYILYFILSNQVNYTCTYIYIYINLNKHLPIFKHVH